MVTLYNSAWFRSKRLTGLPAANTPVIFNVQATAFYRTNYDAKNWAMIAAALKTDHTSIHVINRAQVQPDQINMAVLFRYLVEIGTSVRYYTMAYSRQVMFYNVP